MSVLVLNDAFEMSPRKKGGVTVTVAEATMILSLRKTTRHKVKSFGGGLGLSVRFIPASKERKAFLIICQHRRKKGSMLSLEQRAIALVNQYAKELLMTAPKPALVPVMATT